MTDEPETTKAVALRTPELDLYARLGQWLAASEVENPNEKQVGATAALRMYFAEALGLPPLAAAELSVIRGRLVVSAKLLRALAARGGYRVVRAELDAEHCTAVLTERETAEELGTATFTMEDARRAGLIRDRSAWKTHPQRMLWARASKSVIDDFAPEVALGLVLDDEVAEITGEIVVEEEAEPEPAEDLEQTIERKEQETFVAPKGERGKGGEE